MEFRKVFDTIPEKFDKWRPQYCKEAFDCIINQAAIDSSKSVLEIGPGTGQATEPILKTNCDYLAIELGENLYRFMENKFKDYNNFHIVNGDFGLYDYGDKKFDLVYSAATIQWIPEQIAFSKSFELLKSGGYLAMMMLHGDYKTPNETLYTELQEVYSTYFKPETPYTQNFIYRNALNYGFVDFQEYKFQSERTYNAESYIEYLGTHCDHIVLQEPYRTNFYNGIRAAILKHHDKINFCDTITLYLTKKP